MFFVQETDAAARWLTVYFSISIPKRKSVQHLGQSWDYVITVCGDAKDSCPSFSGKVGTRLHIGFDDPDAFTGIEEQILEEFRRVRDEIFVSMRQL